MPVNIWSHLCDYATVDLGSGKATIVGEFDRIGANTFPVTHGLLAVATKWAVEDGEQFSQTVRILSPDGETVAQAPTQNITAQVPPNQREGTLTNIGYFIGTRFGEPGEYLVQVMINGELDHSIRLTVAQPPRET